MNETARRNYEKLSQIAERAFENENIRRIYETRFPLILDLTYTDKVIPLDFEKLLNFSDLDFFHDITGIYGNFNRKTKQMENYFLPKCARNMTA